MNKLIATEFDYVLQLEHEHGCSQRTLHGSYLGRKVASVRTLRRFVNASVRQCQTGERIAALVVRGNYVSPWIAK